LKGSAADWWYRYPSTILDRVDLSERGSCVYRVVRSVCCVLQPIDVEARFRVGPRRLFVMVVSIYMHNEKLEWIDGRCY
jgi:hypothetical protein